MKRIITLTLILFCVNFAYSQILTPVKWSYASKKISPTEAVIFIKATMQPGWHIYSQYVNEGGPVPTSFNFIASKGHTLNGKTIEPKPLEKFEKTFGMNVKYFNNSVVFQQKIKLNSSQTTVKGKLEFMACDESKCLPPEEVSFSVAIK